MNPARLALPSLAVLLLAATAAAQDLWFDLPFEEVDFVEGDTPAWFAPWTLVDRRGQPDVYVWVEGGEGYLVAERELRDPQRDVRLVLHLPAPRAGRGELFVPTASGVGLEPRAFTFDASDADARARAAFLRGRYEHYERLRQRPIPGGAWFRHEADAARRALVELGVEPPEVRAEPWNVIRQTPGELQETYELFTGGRALSENLALDRVVERGEEATPSVRVADIGGVTTAEMDWAARVEGLAPELDPLAAYIPADQHALFLPSFDALVELVDELRASGAPLLQLVEPRSASERSLERYEDQLCLHLSELARTFGRALVQSVAITGSDPYFRTGTDVAVLFEARQPEALLGFVRAAQQRAVDEHGAALVQGALDGLEYLGADTGDWRVSSYAARIGDVVVVANTLEQLERAAAVAGGAPALAALPEYVFFRDRYPRGAEGETAFLVLGDATIRRWCGPRWRIGASRRLRAAALMAEAEMAHLDALVTGAVEPQVLRKELGVPGGGALSIDARGASSAGYGSPRFLTPIALLDLRLVTEAEARGYERFRAGYESNWRQVFDPIGARLVVSEGELALDLSVMPLAAGTDYRRLIDLTGDVQLEPRAGDLHPEALFHAIYAVDHDTERFRQLDQMLALLDGMAGTGLGWMGESFELYVDDDAVWALLEGAEDLGGLLMEHLYELPVAVRVPVRDPLRLAAFLTALRTTANSAAPGLVRWENRTHAGQPYVAILANASEGDFLDLEGFGIYYMPGPGALVLSLREDLIQRAIDRRLARAGDAEPDMDAPRPWLGESAALRIGRRGVEVLARLYSDDLRRGLQRRAWSNLPVLDEWRRRCPGQDPLALHERVFGVRLLEPAGGEYVWSDVRHGYESSVYGSPGAPLDGPALPDTLAPVRSAELGVGFESLEGSDAGALRARARVLRGGR